MTMALLPTAIVALLRLAAVILLLFLTVTLKPAGGEPSASADMWRWTLNQATRDRAALAEVGASDRQLEDADALIELLYAKAAVTCKEFGHHGY
jgi:hypothetical protein